MFNFSREVRSNGAPRPRKHQLVLLYIVDWTVVVVMACIWAGLGEIEPFHREFSLTNKTIQYPHKPDSVPFYAAVLLCFLFPIFTILLWTGFIRRSFHDMHSGILGLCLSLVLNMMVTNTIKNLAGRHRPDFIARCDLDPSEIDTLEPFIGLISPSVCRQTDKKLLRDGMRSFPSGHTSFCFAGFTYLSLWLAGHMKIGDRRGKTYKSFIVFFPELAALLVGVSRTKDYRHHWQDVLAGAILGVFMGWFGYRQYYPSPVSTKENPMLPYPPRIPENDTQSFSMENFTAPAPAPAPVSVLKPEGDSRVHINNIGNGTSIVPLNPTGSATPRPLYSNQNTHSQTAISTQSYHSNDPRSHQSTQQGSSAVVGESTSIQMGKYGGGYDSRNSSFSEFNR